MLRAYELSHLLLRRSLQAGDWVVDATVGNGHDTLFLAQIVGPKGCVFGFDVQEEALRTAKKRLHGLAQVTLFHNGHEHLSDRLPKSASDQLAAVMFNLGYLPGGDKAIVTRTETTLSAVEQALSKLKDRGLVTLVLYPGHPGGADEAEAVRSFAANLPEAFHASQYGRINCLHRAPELLVIERVS